MIALLQRMDDVVNEVTERLRVAGGQAPVLVHPDYLPITAAELDERIAAELAKQNLTDRERIIEAAALRQDMTNYVQGLRDALHLHEPGVCFLFETMEGRPPHFSSERFTAKLDMLCGLGPAEMIWVVIPTRSRSADPIGASWDETLHRMSDLGLHHPLLGGCYSIVGPNGQPVRPTDNSNWSCVNQVLFQMIDSELFHPALLTQGTYFLPLQI